MDIRYNAKDAQAAFKHLEQELERAAKNLEAAPDSARNGKDISRMLDAIIGAHPDTNELRTAFDDCLLLAESAEDEKTASDLRFWRGDSVDMAKMREGLARSYESQSPKRIITNLRNAAKWARGFLATIGRDGFKRGSGSRFKYITKKDYLRITGMSPSSFSRKVRSGEITTRKKGKTKQSPCEVRVPSDFATE